MGKVWVLPVHIPVRNPIIEFRISVEGWGKKICLNFLRTDIKYCSQLVDGVQFLDYFSGLLQQDFRIFSGCRSTVKDFEVESEHYIPLQQHPRMSIWKKTKYFQCLNSQSKSHFLSCKHSQTSKRDCHIMKKRRSKQ